MNKDKVIKKIKVLERRIEIRSEKMSKLVPAIGDYEYMKYQLLEMEKQFAEQELEKILWDNFQIDYFDWVFDKQLRKRILND